MIRGLIQIFSGLAGKIPRFTAGGRTGESIDDREAFQHYGFASRPKTGAECIIIREGNHFIMIADDDRRYRIALEGGEAAIYTDEGDKVHLKRDRKIEITSGNSLVPGEITIKAEGLTGKINVVAESVVLGKESLLSLAAGVVTGQCLCAFTGIPHAVSSGSVKATL